MQMDQWTEQQFVLNQRHEQLLVVYFGTSVDYWPLTAI